MFSTAHSWPLAIKPFFRASVRVAHPPCGGGYEPTWRIFARFVPPAAYGVANTHVSRGGDRGRSMHRRTPGIAVLNQGEAQHQSIGEEFRGPVREPQREVPAPAGKTAGNGSAHAGVPRRQ